MTHAKHLDDLFFTRTEVDERAVHHIVAGALDGMDDGELFLEYCQSESLSFDDGHLKNASFDTTQGFGLRAVLGEATGYAHASDVSEAAIRRAAETVRAVKSGHNGVADDYGTPPAPARALYPEINPLGEVAFGLKVKLLEEIDAYLRAKDKRVKQVSASLSGEWQAVQILRAGGFKVGDIRPLVRLNISVFVEQGGKMERGSFGGGGRASYAHYIEGNNWKAWADEALRQALVNVEAVESPAGEMDVVLGPGWPGVLLHEAVGHGLEGDHIRKGVSVFAGLMGKRVAAKGVTVVDDGTLPGLRGSITVDDEGCPSGRTTLIEDGILTGLLQDRLSARLMGKKPTGNGRRESFESMPLPRMTNTFMLNGDKDPKEILGMVKNGLYAVNFGGGQVDTASGKFVFSASEAYRIRNGKIAEPVKGATLIGSGNEVLKRIKAIGNDMKLDDGIGTCGKDGQSVPVGVGQPTLLIKGLTVGGTEAA